MEASVCPGYYSNNGNWSDALPSSLAGTQVARSKSRSGPGQNAKVRASKLLLYGILADHKTHSSGPPAQSMNSEAAERIVDASDIRFSQRSMKRRFQECR